MPLWPIEADRLALPLHLFQHPDQLRAEPEAHHQSGQAGAAGSERDVFKQIEKMHVIRERK
jgi:hypothetical protein